MADREKKRGENRNTKIWISQEQKELFRWNKNIFHNYLRAIVWWKNNKNLMMKIKMLVVFLLEQFFNTNISILPAWHTKFTFSKKIKCEVIHFLLKTSPYVNISFSVLSQLVKQKNVVSLKDTSVGHTIIKLMWPLFSKKSQKNSLSPYLLV